MKAIIFPGIVSVALSFIFVPMFKEYGTSVIYLSSEISILILMIMFVRKESIYIVKNNLM
jgi:O-antigen/teichoic acid export membrane protein